MFNHIHSTNRIAFTRIVHSSVTAIVLLLGSFAAHAQTPESANTVQKADTSRAEVIADLALWRRAGVDRYALAGSYGLEQEAYQAAYQDYLRLRNSEEFQLEVQKALQH